MIAGLISVMRAFYSSWEGIPEGFTRGQENISLESGDGIHWTPPCLVRVPRDGKKYGQMKEGLGVPQKMILNIDLRNQFQDEYWSICSWDFNRVSISTLWQQSRYPFIQSSSPYWLICIIRCKELGHTEMNKTHHCPLGVCSKRWAYSIT